MSFRDTYTIYFVTNNHRTINGTHISMVLTKYLYKVLHNVQNKL